MNRQPRAANLQLATGRRDAARHARTSCFSVFRALVYSLLLPEFIMRLLAFACALGLAACGSESDDAALGSAAGAAGASGSPQVETDAGWVDSGLGGAAGSAGAGGSSGAGGNVVDAGPTPDPCPRAEVHVAAGATLNVRPAPNTTQAPVGTLNDGEIVDVLAQVQGEAVSGNTLWFQIKSSAVTGFISANYATCTDKKPPVLSLNGFYLPLTCGKSAKISQGNFGSFSHKGNAAYAYDFSIGVGTPMVAMADGTVKYMYDKTGPGDPCYNGGDSSCFPYANYVVLKHADGTLTTYKHLSKVSVSLGQVIKRGTQIGLSGSTGFSTGPHAHVMRMNDCGQYNCPSIPLEFQDVPGDHVPDTGQTVTSGNCP